MQTTMLRPLFRVRRGLDHLLNPIRRMRRSWRAVSPAERFYRAGYTGAGLIIVHQLWNPDLSGGAAVRWLLICLTFGGCAIGLVLDARPRIERLWNSAGRKVLIAVLTLLIGKLAFVLARREINAITHLDPGQFSNAPASLGLLFTVVLWMELALMLAAGYVVVSMVRAMLRSLVSDGMVTAIVFAVLNHPLFRYVVRISPHADRARHPSPPSFGRVFGGVGVFVVLSSPLIWANPGRIRNVSTAVLLASEYLPYSKCSNHRDGEMVAFVDDYISVARTTRDEVEFELRKCEVAGL